MARSPAPGPVHNILVFYSGIPAPNHLGIHRVSVRERAFRIHDYIRMSEMGVTRKECCHCPLPPFQGVLPSAFALDNRVNVVVTLVLDPSHLHRTIAEPLFMR